MKKTVALTLAVSVLFLAGCCTTHHAKHWEYKTQTVFLDTQFGDQFLKLSAKDGWELVSVSALPKDDNNRGVVVFRRLVQ
jgi:hypothetical protein